MKDYIRLRWETNSVARQLFHLSSDGMPMGEEGSLLTRIVFVVVLGYMWAHMCN